MYFIPDYLAWGQIIILISLLNRSQILKSLILDSSEIIAATFIEQIVINYDT